MQKPGAGGVEAKLIKTIVIKAPPQHVWKFLTTAKGLASWFHEAPHDLEPGGEYRVDSNSLGKEGQKIAWGEVLEMRPFEKLVHTFTHKGLDGVFTTCTWTLTPIEGGTLVTLVHEGHPAGDAEHMSGHDKGWDEHFLRLRFVAA